VKLENSPVKNEFGQHQCTHLVVKRESTMVKNRIEATILAKTVLKLEISTVEN
jgi:hypothetical protein